MSFERMLSLSATDWETITGLTTQVQSVSICAISDATTHRNGLLWLDSSSFFVCLFALSLGLMRRHWPEKEEEKRREEKRVVQQSTLTCERTPTFKLHQTRAAIFLFSCCIFLETLRRQSLCKGYGIYYGLLRTANILQSSCQICPRPCVTVWRLPFPSGKLFSMWERAAEELGGHRRPIIRACSV